MPDEHATRADLLAAVERSPAAAASHDRAGWVGLFITDGVVEDPVGSRPHRGRVALQRFYDTFIGPRDIVFHRDADIAVGATVIRDLELEVRMSAALVMHIPAILRYDLSLADGEWKIARLRAYWELPAMVAQFARKGIAAVPAGLALGRALLANQGPSGSIGFAAGLRGCGRGGKALLAGLLDDAAAGNELAVRRGLAALQHGLDGAGAPMSVSELAAQLAGASPRKVISSGNEVAASVEWAGKRGVVIAELTRRPTTIARLQLFTAG